MPKVPKEKDHPLSVRLSTPLYEWLEEQATSEGMNVSEFVRFLLLVAKRGTLVALLALAIVGSASAAHSSSVIPRPYESQTAERATGLRVLCYSDQAWTRLMARWNTDAGATGLYLYDSRTIALPGYRCWDFSNWHRADPYNLVDDIFALGHELTHHEQYLAHRPFDEHEADCGGLAKSRKLKAALRIARSLPRVFTKQKLHC